MKNRAKADSSSQGVNEGWAVLTTLLGGLVVWGGVGWVLDHWWHTAVATPVGVLLGMALGVYAVVKRYGRTPLPAAPMHPTNQSPWVATFESRLIQDRTAPAAEAGKELR